MSNWPPHILAFLVAILALAGIITLSALVIVVPPILTEVAVAALSGALGLAIPSSGASTTTTTSTAPTGSTAPPVPGGTV